MNRHSVYLIATISFLAIAAFLSSPLTAQERIRGLIAEGTPFETEWHAFDSGQPGPTVLITGGIHGNEPAGARAAQQIATWTVQRGRLVVLPRSNEVALQAGTRRIPGLEGDAGDLNRHFPRDDDGDAFTSLQGDRIWAFVCAQDPDVILDLHEGYGFRAAGSKSVGSSVLTARMEDQEHQNVMLESVNCEIDNPERKFSDIDSVVNGSLVRAAIEQLGIEAHILETTYKGQPLSTRARQHRRMVAALLRHYDMADASVTRLVSPVETKPTIALYDGPGAGSAKQGQLFERILPQCQVERIGPQDVHDGALRQFDLVLFPGGSGSGQGNALDQSGRMAVRDFVKSGGGYVGVCAGAYLALHNYSWGLQLVPLDSFDRKHWRRGTGEVLIEATPTGETILGLNSEEEIEIYFGQGPLMVPAAESDLPAPAILSYYRTGIGKNGADPQTMVDTPAIVSGQYGFGRVILFSPHPEKTAGLEDLIMRAIDWGTDAAVSTPESTKNESAIPQSSRNR